jgi:hypothetical protein
MLDSKIKSVLDAVIALINPTQIYLYNKKVGSDGKVKSFKLCVVSDFVHKPTAERQIYVNIDSEVPFDVLLYSNTEWNDLSPDASTFAYSVLTGGEKLYG